MQIDFKSDHNIRDIKVAEGAIDTLSFKADLYTLATENYVVTLSQKEMQRLAAIYGYTCKAKLA